MGERRQRRLRITITWRGATGWGLGIYIDRGEGDLTIGWLNIEWRTE